MNSNIISSDYVREREDALPAGDLITAVSENILAQTDVEWHSHDRHQLMYTTQGAMVVQCDGFTWVTPNQRAIWMPANIAHNLRTLSKISLRNLLIVPGSGLNLPKKPCVITVSNLLRALILKVVEQGSISKDSVTGSHITALIVDEVRSSSSLPLQLPEAKDPRLMRVCAEIHDDPSIDRTFSEWAGIAGASNRTLSRLFAKDTGMSFTLWRQQARLLKSLELLALGQPVTTVALDVGYESASAFIDMFRKSLGQTPSKYFHQTD